MTKISLQGTIKRSTSFIYWNITVPNSSYLILISVTLSQTLNSIKNMMAFHQELEAATHALSGSHSQFLCSLRFSIYIYALANSNSDDGEFQDMEWMRNHWQQYWESGILWKEKLIEKRQNISLLRIMNVNFRGGMITMFVFSNTSLCVLRYIFFFLSF